MGEDVGPATLAVPKEEGHPTKPMPLSAGVKCSFFFAWSARTSLRSHLSGKNPRSSNPSALSQLILLGPWNRLD